MIEAIENSAYSVWVRESPSIFAFTSILALHAIGLAIIVGINAIIALRLLGYVPEIPVAKLKRLYPWAYVGFAVNAFSGASLMASMLQKELDNWMFLTKLGFIALAMINMELIRMRVFDDPVLVSGGVVPSSARKFAIASLALWSLAIISGRLTSYPYMVEAWVGKLAGG
jgi:hypothetical protein